MDELQFMYDPKFDILTVEGVKYTGAFFRDLARGVAIGVPFVITKRENELVYISRLPQGQPGDA